ncbi:hypothetical protein E1301_Tti019437 [Triplophysa tibetana]|uniref:Uncharacterized protein n=1 Tax=Triplophysa tibetana TaxID=1572043 RepID=A0A5A9PLF6_9TELE|nr:hypothetical protein E1301_Tti019437 [Triplophysa tibetana]
MDRNSRLHSNATEAAQLLRDAARVLMGPSQTPGVSTQDPDITARQNSVQSTLSSRFRPYGSRERVRRRPRPFTTPWSHDFFCLAEPHSTSVPRPEETVLLHSVGLGKRRVRFMDNKCSFGEFCSNLYGCFPALKECGGFKMMRATRNKELIDIPVPPGGYTIDYLRNESGLNRAMTYVVPLQHRLVACNRQVVEQMFDDLLRRTFPQLGNKPYEFCKVDRHRAMHVLPSILKTPKDVKMYPDMGRSALYLRPKSDQDDRTGDTSDAEPENDVMQDRRIQEAETYEQMRLKVLFDFIGSHQSATELFIIRERTSALSAMNNAPGALIDYNIASPLNIHVQWLFKEDMQTDLVASPQHSPVASLLYSPTASPSAAEASTVENDYIYDEFEDILFSQVCNLKSPAPDIEEIFDYDFREKMKAIQSAQNVAIIGASEELSMLGSLRHIQTLEDRDDMVVAATNFLLESRLRDSVEQ